MSTEPRYRIRYVGSPSFASLFVHQLEQEGVEVVWEPPEEYRGAADLIEPVILGIVAAGSYEAIKLVVSRFLQRFPSAKVEVEPDDDPDEFPD